MDSHVFIKRNDEQTKRAKTLIWACFILFTVMQGAKNTYTAEIVAIQDFFGKTKAEASLAMTYYFLVYGITQVLLSPILAKINLKIFLTTTTALSSLLTIGIAFMPSMGALCVLCAVNGALQAGVYGGLMGSISKYSPSHVLPFANRVMSASVAINGLISYGVPVYFVAIGRWELPFIILGIAFLLAVVFFFWAIHRLRNFASNDAIIKVNAQSLPKEEQPFVDISKTKSKVIYFTVLCVIVFFGNAMYFILMQWIPSLLIENFAMPPEYSILITLIVPIISFFFSLLSIFLCERYNNLFKISALLAFISLIVILPMIFLYKVNILLTLISVVLFIALGTGSRACYGSILAFKMRNQLNSGTYLIATNAAASLAAAVIPPLGGSIIDSSGYSILFLILSVIVLLNCLLVFGYSFNVKKK